MRAEIFPLRTLIPSVLGRVNRHQADAIVFLVEENKALKEQVGGRRLRLTDDQCRRLAAKVKLLGRKTLDQVATIVTPHTLMLWRRRLIAPKWTTRPSTSADCSGAPGARPSQDAAYRMPEAVVGVFLSRPCWSLQQNTAVIFVVERLEVGYPQEIARD
ncbi:MAG: hypothetical protein ACI9K5_003524 [Gammaproteobacteria bacterium]|jgi:hypothetical protein